MNIASDINYYTILWEKVITFHYIILFDIFGERKKALKIRKVLFDLFLEKEKGISFIYF